ncbi:MAG: hypothetical protein ACRD8A_06795 [Candidatus Acidiferrales bacterium]
MGKRLSVPVPGSGTPVSSRKRAKPQRSGEEPLGSAEVCSADFAIAWKALPWKRTGIGFSGFAVSVSQRIRRKNKQEMWKSVAIRCEDDPDGALLLRILVCDPEWDGPMQIAELRSRPDDLSCLTPLACNLDQIENEKS